MYWLHAISEALTSAAYLVYATAWLVAAMNRKNESER